MQEQGSKFVYRSVFWPVILIGVGLLLFLGNIQAIPGLDWRMLAALWPILLVGIGLDLIIGRRWVWVSALIGIATVGAAYLMMAYAPALGLFKPSGEVRTYTFSEPVGSATSAKVTLDLSGEPARVRALADAATLFQADITHNGEMQFSASGSGAEKVITLKSAPVISWGWWNFSALTAEWVIGLSPKLPLALEVDVSAGTATLDLTGLQLSSLNVDGGAGQCNLTLPASSKAYAVDYEGSAGSAQINLPAETDLSLSLDGSAGSINVRLPANAAVRVEVQDEGAGSVSLASSLKKISGTSAKKGVWETDGFASAKNKISIVIKDVSAGSINIR